MLTQPPKSRRETLRDQIVDDVRAAIREELAGAERPPTEEHCGDIEAEILAYTTRILAAVSIGEMQSQGALLAHIASARAETNRLIRQRPPRSGGTKVKTI
jgi:hypothetical protein